MSGFDQALSSRGKPVMSIDISTQPNLAILVTEFNALDVDIRSFREPLGRAVRLLSKSIADNFRMGGRPYAWDPLSDVTLVLKSSEGFPLDPLIRTGLLSKTASQINIWDMTTEQATAQLSSRVAYGSIHNSGSKTKAKGKGSGRGGGNIPSRPFMLAQEEDEVAIEEVFVEWFAERLDRHGFRRGVI